MIYVSGSLELKVVRPVAHSYTNVVMMILTDPRKGIWILPGVSHEIRNENQSTSQRGQGCRFTEQNDMKYTPNGFIQNRNTYSTLLSPLFFKHKKRLILNHCQNLRFFHIIFPIWWLAFKGVCSVHIDSELINAFLKV